MFLNANIPHFKAYVRKEFVYNLEAGFGETIPAIVFGVSSVTGRMLGWHVMFENGAVYWRLPTHALLLTKDGTPLQAHDAQCWDNISNIITVTCFDFLKEKECVVKLKSGEIVNGTYMFTIDYTDSQYADSADEHKCSHIIATEKGSLISYPNNRVMFRDAAFTTSFGKVPDFKVNTHIWSCEGKFKTEDEDAYFYTIKE